MSNSLTTDKPAGGFFHRLKPSTIAEHIERVHEVRIELADAERDLHLAMLEEAERKGSGGADYGERQVLDACCEVSRVLFDRDPSLADAVSDSWVLDRGCDEPDHD